EVVWRLRFQGGGSLSALLAEADFPTLEALKARWGHEERKMGGYLGALTDTALAAKLTYKNTKGAPFRNGLWPPLVHVVNPGAQFRGEAAVALTEYGQSPGNLDLLAFVREQKP